MEWNQYVMDAYLAATPALHREEQRIHWFMMLNFFTKWKLFHHYYHELNFLINLVLPLLLQCESGKIAFVKTEKEFMINLSSVEVKL